MSILCAGSQISTNNEFYAKREKGFSMNIILNKNSFCVAKPPKGYVNITFDFSKTESVPDSVRGILENAL